MTKNEKLLRAIGELPEDLIAEAAPAEKKRKPRLSRWLAAAAAAVLVLTLAIGAGAAGELLKDVFAPAFPAAPEGTVADPEVIEKLGTPVGVSATDGLVTFTLDSIVRDRYTVTAVFTVSGLDAKEIGVDAGALRVGGMSYEGPSGHCMYTPNEEDVEGMLVVSTWSAEEPIPAGEAEILLENITVYRGRPFLEKHIAGAWQLNCDLSYEDMTLDLPAGQTLSVEGMEVTLDQISLSPLSLMLLYTAHTGDADLEEPLPVGADGFSRPLCARLESLDLVITKKDGATLTSPEYHGENEGVEFLGGGWGYSDEADGTTSCQSCSRFEQVIPLEDIASITIEGVEVFAQPTD